MKTIRVVAAIIRKDNKIFATQRGYGDFKDGWEFPGGKIEEGESPEHAITREIKEELDADIVIGDLLTTVEYDYPEFHLSMNCFWAELAPESEMKLLEHEAAKWLSIDEIDTVEWLPADVQVVNCIKGLNMAGVTSQYYSDNSQEFFESTVTADMTPLYEHFLKYVSSGSTILDFGCGSGRDTKAFLEMGYHVVAIDGSEELCRLASDYTGIKVKCMDFMELNSFDSYDAIWACASLLHVPSTNLPILLSKMKNALRGNGIIHMSFKHGDFEGERNGRFFLDMTSDRLHAFCNADTGFHIEEEWYSEDVRNDKDVKWYNCIVRKI